MRGTSAISFDHDPEHQRYSQLTANGLTLYIGGGGVLAERFAGAGTVQWTNYLFAAGQMIGVFIERSDETVATRYFHLDHLGSVSVITDENGVVVERLSYDAWGLRRHPDGTPDPAGAITSQSTRGFTGHEHLAEVGLIHMNGRVYDPLLGRFGTPDPMTENPFSTQGWNRYSYVGNSPVNFTDPSGYCFLGCFWKPIFKAIQRVFQKIPILGSILQIAAGAICGPPCAVLASAFVAGVTSGDLGLALKAGFITAITIGALDAVGTMTTGHGAADFMSPAHVQNMAGHALVGCGSSVASGGKCGPGALSGAAGSFGGPLMNGMDVNQKLVAHAVVGGAASVAGGGKFANGAVTAAFGYLFNEMGSHAQRGYEPTAYEGGMICNGPDGPGCVQAGARALSLFDDPIFLLFGGASLKGGVTAAETGGALVARETYHALDQMARRGVTSDMVTIALERGTPYWDPLHGTIVHVLRGGMASGKDLAVALNPQTRQVTTVMTNFRAVRPRFFPIAPP